MSKPKAPTPPDPIATGAAQTGTNVGTAISNAMLNNYNQVTPYGSLAYDQTGTYTYTDPQSGKSYEIPRFTATQTLSPGQQNLFNKTEATQFNLADLAKQQSGFLKDYMATPFDGSNEATEKRLFELGRQRLDPLMADRRSSLDTQLANQGIRLGSAAYDRALRNFGQQENDAYNNLLLSGRGQAFSEGQAIRNQPINEITALLSGSQVQQPGYVNTQNQQIPTTDYAGLIQQNYQNQFGQWQQQQQNRNSILGGLFGLGSSFIMSDRRLKTDIDEVGKTNDGQPIYRYRYKAGGPFQLGLMAQDVEKKHPEAVVKVGGFKAVDYAKALEARHG